jgi:dolichol-phosphate mannosyltransferase
MALTRGVIVIPTYNEKDNIAPLIEAIWRELPGVDFLIVDDNSPDGTGILVDELSSRFPGRIETVHRPAKQGLGPAYLDGFRRVITRGYDYIVQMDADFSHDPVHLKSMIESLDRCDLVLGSRYLQGVSVVNWDFKRLILSKCASQYARLITGLPFSDLTGGYKVWRASALQRLDLAHVFAQGYLFQIEMTWRAFRGGLRIEGSPIIFQERRFGQSKIDFRIIREAALGVIRLRLAAGLRRDLANAHGGRDDEPAKRYPSRAATR